MVKKKNRKRLAGQLLYLQSSNIELPEGYITSGGFLFKGEVPVSLVTSGLKEIAAQGFLHVDETEKYVT